MLRIQPLAYGPDSAGLFAPLAQEPWAAWLDSGGQGLDILVARPSQTLVCRGAMTRISAGDRQEDSDLCPFELLRQALGPRVGLAGDFGFVGGALGYFGYDLGRRIEQMPDFHLPHPMPDMAFGIYPWALRVDHGRKTRELVALADRLDESQWQALVGFWRELIAAGPGAGTQGDGLRASGRPQGVPDFEGYARAFAAVQDYICAGDCYQVNLARRFSAEASGDPWPGYCQLRARSPAPFGAYLNLPFGQILSNSPERFMRVQDGRVMTSPIKGSRPRHAEPELDAASLRELEASTKDRAENLMIVDLLRNNLGKVCVPGSVEVEALFRSASFATVHHLISDISGRLRPEHDALSLLKAAFPGGSITGAPKLRAMGIIEELEVARRGPYCGSLAWMGFDGSLDSNILIRTLVHQAGRLEFWAGGGIVADSRLEDEFAETQHKARAMLEMLGGVD